MTNDPVHEEADGWYFWDETWADRYGPYPDEKFARMMMRRYLPTLNGYSPYLLFWSPEQRAQIEAMIQTSPTKDALRQVGDSVIRATTHHHVNERAYGKWRFAFRQKLRGATSHFALRRFEGVAGALRFT